MKYKIDRENKEVLIYKEESLAAKISFDDFMNTSMEIIRKIAKSHRG